MNKELVSIVLPIYGVENYLHKCVDSIIKQTYTNLEIILVDDGSPDNCPQICDEYKEKDNRIIVIHKENGGLSDARNAGLSVATGDYISFIDSDDYISKDFVETLMNVLLSKNADIVECGVTFVDEDNKILKTRNIQENSLELDKIDALKRLILERGVYQTVWNKLYRRKVIGEDLFPVGKLNEDEYWTYKVIEKSDKVIVIDKAMYFYLQRKASIMGNQYSIKRFDGLKAKIERYDDLKIYNELSGCLDSALMYDLLFHYQSAIHNLKGNEKKNVVNYIKASLKKAKHLNLEYVSKKYRVWFFWFRRCPYLISKIRNILGIGL